MASFTLQDEAESLQHLQATIQHRINQASDFSKKQAPILGSAWDEYLKNPNRLDSGEKTLSDYKIIFNQFKTWLEVNHTEIKSIKDIRYDIAEEYANILKEKNLSPNRYNKHICFLRLFFKTLKRSANLSENPFEDIQILKNQQQEIHHRRDLSEAEIDNIIQKADGDLKLLLIIGACTGQRLNDCRHLKWDNVNFKTNEINLIPSKTARRKPISISIPIFNQLKTALLGISANQRTGCIVPSFAVKPSNDVSAIIQDHFITCGIATTADITGRRKKRVVVVGFHSLRHSFVTKCIDKNIPMPIIQSWVGHGSYKMTEHYSHANKEMVKQFLPLMDGTATPPKMVEAEKVKKIISKLTPKTIQQVKAEIEALINSA